MLRSCVALLAPVALCAFVLSIGCGEDPCAENPSACADAATPDAATPDAATPDSGPPDIGFFDAGHVSAQSGCLACASGCTGGSCVRTNAEEFCADFCQSETQGEPCIAGFSCIDIEPDPNRTFFVCVPPSGTCVPPGIGFGAPCYESVASCLPDFTACEGDRFAMGFCTRGCTDDASCPPPYACGLGDEGERVCLPRFGAPAERCGREGEKRASGETACAWDGDCAADRLCVAGAAGQPSVCATIGCSVCEADNVCRTTGSTGRSACLSAACACRGDHRASQGGRDLFGEALAQVGLDRCSAIDTVSDWITNASDMMFDPYRLSFFHPVHDEPWRAPSWARATVGRFDAAALSAADGPAKKAARMIEVQAELSDHPAVRHPPTPADPNSPLVTAMVRFIESAGGTADRAAIAADAADLSPLLDLAFAQVVEGARQAYLARREAYLDVSADSARLLYDYGPAFVVRRADGFGLNPKQEATAELINRAIRYGELFGGAADLLSAIDEADLARFRVAPSGTATVATSTAVLVFSQVTSVGRIAIGDGQNGIYDPRIPGFDGPWAILLDLGGHDTYRVGAGGNQSVQNGVSALIDLGGRDRYAYVEVPDSQDGPRLVSDDGGRFHPTGPDQGGPVSLSERARQGGGRVGIGVLVDLGADDDRYRSLRLSQGAGAFGVGVLVDEGGNDDYEGEAFVQGAGAFGLGLHVDFGGNDRYRAVQMAQGFAFARAVGLAYDGSGDDTWLLDVGDPAFGGDPLYPSAQLPTKSNASLGQGFAFGRRADFSDRAFMSGGLGILADAAGNDTYEGSVFTLGGGYWFGTGIFADARGNDRYDGLWYAMAGCAHHALGVFLDGAGDDQYGGRLPRVAVTLGAGHDFSTAFLVEEGGNDHYYGSSISLGSGNSNGKGFFVDNAGNDVYEQVTPFSVGAAALREDPLDQPGSARLKVDTIGVFVDAGGQDSYREANGASADAKDNAMWKRSQSTEERVKKTERAGGIDAVGDSTVHARWP